MQRQKKKIFTENLKIVNECMYSELILVPNSILFVF